MGTLLPNLSGYLLAAAEYVLDVREPQEPAPAPALRELPPVRDGMYRWRTLAAPESRIPANQRQGMATQYVNTPINMRFNRARYRIRNSAHAPADEVVQMLLHFLGETINNVRFLKEDVRTLRRSLNQFNSNDKE